MEVVIGCIIFFAAGAMASLSAIKNARTSTDLETGRWVTIGLLLMVGSVVVAWLALP